MVTGTAKLVIDLGNSSTRVRVTYGKNSKGISRMRKTELSNRFHNLGPAEDTGELRRLLENDSYSPENSTIFKLNGEYYCNGKVCQSEYNGGSIRPSASGLRKYEDMACKLALANAFRFGYESVMDITGSELEALQISWELVLQLPPEDLDGDGPRRLAELARSITHIDYLMPNMSVDVSIAQVKVYSEGMCALVAIVLENPQKPRPEYSYLQDPEELTMIIDIGAGTSDLSLAQGIKIITSSRYTANIGGNNVAEKLDDLLRRKKLRLSDKIISGGAVSGKIKLGSTMQDISKDVDIARSEVAQSLINETNKFLERNSYSLQSINNLLICGGGAVESEIPGVQSLAEYVIKYIKQIAEYINVIELPYVTNEDGVREKVSPRELNIIGATILAEA